jgi:hypothetical protein
MSRDASVAPTTVTDISRGKHQTGVAKTRQASKRAHPAGTRRVVVIKPDQRVWKQAVQMAGGNVKRLEVRDHETVVVHNNNIR